MLKPKLAILDETDSGLDVDAVRTVSAGIREYQKNSEGSLLVITHSTKILESLPVDYTHVMVEGKIIKTGGAGLVDEINEAVLQATSRGAQVGEQRIKHTANSGKGSNRQ